VPGGPRRVFEYHDATGSNEAEVGRELLRSAAQWGDLVAGMDQIERFGLKAGREEIVFPRA
jgi:hypothetical protein